MMRVLLKNQIKIALNTLRTQKKQNYIGILIAAGIFAVVLYFISKFVWSQSEAISGSILEGMLSFGFLAIIGMIVLMGLPQIFKNLYASTDLETLFTMPIKTRDIFWVKYIQNFFGLPVLIYVVLIIPLTVYGIATEARIIYYPVMLLVMLAVIITGLSIAFLFNLIFIQIVPKSRANEFMTVMSFLSGIFVYLLFMLPNIVNDQPVEELLLAGLPVLPKWVPVSWGSAAIMQAHSGGIDFVLPFILIVLLALVSVMVATALVERGFRSGWIQLSEGSSKKKKKRKTKSDRQILRHPVIALGKKEWFSIKRDLREWFVFLPILFFLVFGVIGFFSGGGSINLSEVRTYNNVSWPVAQGVLLFMYAMMNGTVAASSLGREGASLWVLRTLPVSGQQLALGKFWISWLLPFVIVSFFELIAGLVLGWSVWQFLLGFVTKAMMTAGVSALGLWLGTHGAKYNPMNPQARLNVSISLILFVASIVYLLIVAIPFSYMLIPVDALDLPANLDHGLTGFVGVLVTFYLKLLLWKQSFPILMGIVGFIVLSLLTLGLTSLFIWLSARKIDKGIKIDIVSESSSKPLFKRKPGGSL